MFLFIYSLAFSAKAIAEDITIPEDIVITVDTIWEPGAYTNDNVTITNNSTLIFNGAVTFNANNLNIEAGSSISANGKGYSTYQGPGAGNLSSQFGSGEA